MQKYERSHSWLNFKIDLSRAPAKLWMVLGEAQSKCEHIAGVPLPPAVADELHRIYLAKGVWATTAIEGNTLTEKQVRQRLNGQLPLPLSQEYLGQEVDNVVEACNQIIAHVQDKEFAYLTVEGIKIFNRQVLHGLTLEEGIVPGEIPTHSVVVANYLGAPRDDCEYLLGRMCDWLNSPDFLPQDETRLTFGLLRAALAHLYLVWIHPFGDGNGRTSRLLEYQILLAAGVPSPAAHLLSNHYNQTRPEYYRQLTRSSQGEGTPIPFLVYALSGFVEGLRMTLETIRQLQWTISWRDYVHAFFHNKDSPVDKRRRHLVLDLSEKPDPVPLSEMRGISPRVAEDYAGKGPKTLPRDLTYLEAEGLVERVPSGFRAKRELILQFLPFRREGEA